ncbi:MAG: transketolase [Acidimicrobiia bacterium]|nr:transketolase [Acidimicrobiia bacterium]MBP8180433.1 transketolase [Acidimicrobiia bacterium]
MSEPSQSLEQRAVDVARGLILDSVAQAQSGHTGTALALAPLAQVLYGRVMKYDAANPTWFDRDRLILSAGHASMLLYSSLFLHGFGLTIDDLKAFRQFGSVTPGHPESGVTAGVEVTTGPLGQGFANGVGMAIAERNLRARFGAEICDHSIFGICSDGDLEEGLSHEAASLAGHLGLGKIVYIYDDNDITIDGKTSIATSDDVKGRFESYHWHVVEIGESANDLDALEYAIRTGIAETERPTLVVLKSHIGYPSKRYLDTSAAHGAITDPDEIAEIKTSLGLAPDEKFQAPADVVEFCRLAGRRGGEERRAWDDRVAAWAEADPERGVDFEAALAGTGRTKWAAHLPRFDAGQSIATRKALQQSLNAIADSVPGLIGGSADLTESTGVDLTGLGVLSNADFSGRGIHFGIREHAMGSAAVGMALHGGSLPATGTFLVFSDYMRPPIRMAALSQAKVLFCFSHDSIGVGEDGPTHQPVEQLASLRIIPELNVFRPADANEVAASLAAHIDGDGPSVLLVSRQNLPVLAGTLEMAGAGVARGAYILRSELAEDADPALQDRSTPDLVLVASGSEVSLAVDAAELLEEDGVAARVVSMPCWERFEALEPSERGSVLPPDVPTIAIEAGTSFGWDRFADLVIGLDRFGASAPGGVVMKELGFSAEAVRDAALRLLDRSA